MSLPTLDRYHTAFNTVHQTWAFDRLLQDLEVHNGNATFTNAQVRHLRALLAWADLRALNQLEEGDRLQHPKHIMAQILRGSASAITTEVSRSIAPCVKKLLGIDLHSKLKFAQIPTLLQEKGYRLIAPTLGINPNGMHPNGINPTLGKLPISGIPASSRKLALVPTFYGRESEQQKLDIFLQDQHRRLILVCGRGGVGKTWLVSKWLESLQSSFPYIIPRRGWDRPSLAQLIWDIVQYLPGYIKADMPDSADQQIAWLINALCTHKCLVILDDIHNLFQIDIPAGSNSPAEAQGIDTTNSKCYEVLFEQLATNQDYQQSESCVVGIGWYRPSILARVEDPRSPIPTLELKGLDFEAAQHILAECNLIDDQPSWQKLVNQYRGVPYSLKLVGNHISQIYGKNTSRFLADETVFLGDAESLIHQQFQSISDLCCKLVWLVLSKEGSCTSASEMRRQINQQHQLQLSVSDVGRSLQTLYEMKLIEQEGDRFSPPPDIAKYALKRYQAYLPQLTKRLRSPE